MLTGKCLGVQVTLSEYKKVAMLFQPVVLQCKYTTTSNQKPVVQWRFKSYCQDRTKDAFRIQSIATHVFDPQNPKNLNWDPYLDCADNSRTVRVVASSQGSAVTLGEYYKGREITISNNADLQIGRLYWGDSGVYYCSVITSDDIVGNSEQRMELLVMGRSGVVADLLPGFDVEFMPEWAFVGLVGSGTLLLLILFGICWCQCCPHTCCCYVRCPCCPESCCCPRALYEAGKAIKAGHNIAAYQPYCIPSVSRVPIPITSTVMDTNAPPPTQLVENDVGGSVRSGYRIQANKEQDSMKVLYYVEKELAEFDPSRRKFEKSSTISELSSLHEQDTDLRQVLRQARKPALPTICDQEESGIRAELARRSGRFSGREKRDDDRHSHRSRSRSCERQKMEFHDKGQSRSMNELEDFAESYHCRGRRGNSQEPNWERKDADRGEYYRALRDRYHGQDCSSDDYYNKRSRSRSDVYDGDKGHAYNNRRERREEYPLRYTHDGDGAYDDAFINSILERKANCRSYDESYCNEIPSQSSSRRGNDYYYEKPSSYRAEEEEILPPYSEMQLQRARPENLAIRPYYQQRENDRKEQTRQKKMNQFPARDALVV
uniref:Immunoglobulin domain-containing protein n=1 Tax=Callorhinchus milii TaxID=7868 RepID=A0A4W3GCC8_CALMI